MRRSPISLRLGLLVGVLACGVARPARALENNDGEIATARLEIQARPRCATRDDIVARVAARSRRIRLVEDANARPMIMMRVIITAAGHRVAAELLTLRTGGQMSSRRLSAASCAQAVDAVALIIALTLDPTHVVAEPAARVGSNVPSQPSPPAEATRDTSSSTEKSAAAPPSAVANEPTTSAPRVTPSPVDRARDPVAAEAADAPARVAREPDVVVAPVVEDPIAPDSRESSKAIEGRRRFSVGVAGALVSGPAPSIMGGAALYAMATLDRDAIWSPGVVLWGAYAKSNSVVAPSGTASFALSTVSVDACALRVALENVDVRLCATATVGRLSASGSHTYSPASESRPYAALGGATLVTVGIGRQFVVMGRFGADASLVRDAFSFAPNVFYRSAALTLSSDLALGVRFP